MTVIDEGVINERKQTLLSDLEVVRTRLTEIRKKEIKKIKHCLMH